MQVNSELQLEQVPIKVPDSPSKSIKNNDTVLLANKDEGRTSPARAESRTEINEKKQTVKVRLFDIGGI